MKVILYFLCTLLVSVSFVTLGVLIYSRAGEFINFQQEALKVEITNNKNEAIDGCFENSRINSTSGTSLRSEPLIELYHQCLADKEIVVPSSN
ncbi:MAG: hypothetical protein ABIM99_03900 [Candidatus Dojkabacteria bacterium]